MTPTQSLRRTRKLEGLCEKCGEPSNFKTLCDQCAAYRGVKKRFPLKSQWDAVDWNMRDSAIAKILGVTQTAAMYYRERHNKPEASNVPPECKCFWCYMSRLSHRK
jgi:hypothetical protein